MKPSLVLSNEERTNRFNKVLKLKKQLSIPEVQMKFTVEEQKTVDELHLKFKLHQESWLRNLFILNAEAGVNVLESMLNIKKFDVQNFKYLEEIYHFLFSNEIAPKLIEGLVQTSNVGQIINGKGSSISHMFKMYGSMERIRGFECSTTKQVMLRCALGMTEIKTMLFYTNRLY